MGRAVASLTELVMRLAIVQQLLRDGCWRAGGRVQSHILKLHERQTVVLSAFLLFAVSHIF